MTFEQATEIYNRIDAAQAAGDRPALDAVEADVRQQATPEELGYFLRAIVRARQPWQRPVPADGIILPVDSPPLKLE